MRRTQSGFALAEEDLKLRGPGDFFGARQHGLPTLRVADFACDMELLYEAQGAAEEIAKNRCPAGAETLDKWAKYSMIDNEFVYATVVIEYERDIASRMP